MEHGLQNLGQQSLETELDGKRLFHEEELWPNKQFASVLLIGKLQIMLTKILKLFQNFLNLLIMKLLLGLIRILLKPE